MASMEQQVPSPFYRTNVLLFKDEDVTRSNGEMYTPNLMELSTLRRTDQFKKHVCFHKDMSDTDVSNKLKEVFPVLINRRFLCATSAVGNNARLDFDGERRVWNGAAIKKKAKGNRCLYIVPEVEDLRQSNADAPTDQMDCLTSSDFSDQESANQASGLTMVSESSDYFSEGCSSQSRQGLQQWEDGTTMDPMYGPIEGGTSFKIRLNSSFVEFEHLLATFVGIPRSKKVVHCEGNIWLGLTPKGNKPGPVQVVFKTPNEIEIGTASFIYYDDDYLCSTVFQLPSNSDMEEHQGNSGAGVGNNSGAGNNSDNCNPFGWSSQGRDRQAVDVLRWSLYTAARNGFRQFIRLLFGTFAGRIIVETYKNKTPLPEDIADANGHSEIAVFLRGVTERFSSEGGPGPAQSKVINWSELARAVREIDSDHCKGEEKLWKDESLEKPYFADVSSSDSDKENIDSDEELKRVVFKDSKRGDEKEQQVPNHLLKSKLCGDESDEPDDPLSELTKLSLEDGQELHEAFSEAKQEGKWKQDSQGEEKEQTERTNFPKSDKSGEPVVPELITLSLEDGQAAARIVGMGRHFFRKHKLLVSLLLEAAESLDPEDEDVKLLEMDSSSVENGHAATNASPDNNFSRSQGAEASMTPIARGKTPKSDSARKSSPQQCTVKVTGILADTSEDLLRNYFENERRSKGGPVSHIDVDREHQECLITFDSPDDAAKTVENSPHKVAKLCLDVSLLEVEEDNIPGEGENQSRDESHVTIIVSGTLPSKDALWNYFENERRSGGGEILNLVYNDEGDAAVITFSEVKDIKRLVEGSHVIDKTNIAVTKQPPKKKVPLDPMKIHVQGLNETTSEDCLRFYLEKFTKVEVAEVFKGYNNNALAIFDAEPDFEVLLDKVGKDPKGLEGKHLRIERVPVCSGIHVKGLKKETSDDTIELYFENHRKSGGSFVSRVERKEKDEALVYFEDPSSVQEVIKRNHTLDQQNLEVKPYYPFLENTKANKKEMAFDSEVFEYIQMHHQHDLQVEYDKQRVHAELSEGSVLIICPTEKKIQSPQLWQKRTECLESFLTSFKKIQVPIAADLFDEITRRWEKQNGSSSPSGPSDYVLLFNARDQFAQIIGRTSCVEEEELKLKELIDAAKKDTELMRSIVEVEDRDIPMARLRLLKLSGTCQELVKRHQHLAISIDLISNRLSLKGPRSVLQEVKLEIYQFISKMMEKALELPINVINVLKNPRVSEYTQSLLKQKNIPALFIPDLAKHSNEILVVGVGPKSLTDAEAVLQNAIQERSLRLTQENMRVLENRDWKDLVLELNSSFKVGISEDWSFSTLWVSGIVGDVEICFGRVQHFLAVNTIYYQSLSLDQGTLRFILEKWKTKIDEIKNELAQFYVEMRAAPDCKSIQVTGTAKGLEQFRPMLKKLISTVQKDSLPVDKPGVKKFILEEKGTKALRAIEDRNNCVIITKASNEDEEPFVEVNPDIRDIEKSSSKFMCSYLTKEGKKISVFQGDITKHQVDVVVNAANSQLAHVGGVAAAIVKAGGQEIQTECNDFIRDKGILLEGHVLVTTAGGLPCDKVIHTVGPQWIDSESPEKKQKKERLLKYAIKNCLEKAQGSKTIAIPAVSSGIYGVPRDQCANVILDAVHGFCTENPGCTLSEIHLINNDDPTVKAFVDEMRKRFAEKTTFIDKEGPEVTTLEHDPRSSEHKVKPKKTAVQSTKNIHITVKIDDLAKVKADILVGTAASDLDLTKNPCSRSLSEAAGTTLQQQCTKKGPVAEGDIAVIDKTGSLKCDVAVFAVCPQWNNGKGKEALKGILLKCLQEADKRKMASIAFASIGTGTLKFPPDQVADIYFHEVISFDKKHPTTSIRDVRFILYGKDTPTVQAFQAAELTTQTRGSRGFKRDTDSYNQTSARNGASFEGSSTFSPVKERKPNHFETTVGSLCFQVQPGDITKETTDAIAVISNGQLDLSSSGTGAAILRSGGDSIEKECSKRAPQNPGSVVITAAGRLKARYLCHIIPDDLTPTGLKGCLVQCLKKAERKNMSSICFPAIGTGVLGISAKTCADVMLSAILELVKEKPTSLKLVKMTIFQESMVKEIRLAMDEASGVKSSQESGWRQAIGKGFKTVASAFGFGGNDESATEPRGFQGTENINLDLLVYAGCEKDLQEAIKGISELMKENCKQKIIEHEAINSLTQEHLHRIHTLELRYSVEVNVEKQVERIVLDGQADDVLQVFGGIHEILHEVKKNEHERSHAEMLSKDVQWKYRENEKFEDYESEVNAQIELAYQQKKSIVMIMRDDEKHSIDFDAMTENDEDGNTNEVRRIDLRKDVEFPNYWTPQPTDANGREETLHLFELDPLKDTLEYKKVSDLFRKSCPQNIIKIERVQNPPLYGTYAVKKVKMNKEKAQGSNEMLLFHGTKGPKCQLINHKGFNRSFCAENAACYGNGVYFALHAAYSARSTYSPADTNGHRHMYLARVIVGEYTGGKQGILTPPAKRTNDLTDTYDTVVDNVSNPSIYVVFDDWQCYPEYLITFQ